MSVSRRYIGVILNYGHRRQPDIRLLPIHHPFLDFNIKSSRTRRVEHDEVVEKIALDMKRQALIDKVHIWYEFQCD